MDPGYRRRGIAFALVRACVEAMRKAGVWRVYLFARKTNGVSNAFWKRASWRVADDVHFFSRGIR